MRYKYLDDAARALILEMHSGEHDIYEIAKATGYSAGTVWKVTRPYRQIVQRKRYAGRNSIRSVANKLGLGRG